MQSKLCLVLALAVLVGALVGGNPFLDRGAEVSLRAAPAAAGAGSTHLPQAQTAAFEPGRGAGFVPAAFGQRHQTPLCPEPSLQDRVVAVRYDAAGQPVWLLDDGRLVRRNPQTGPGQPKVVAVAGASGPSGDAEDETDGR